jgi:hypothetical protein
VTTDDPSQIPVERLAQLLLQHARTNAELVRRPPANDNASDAAFVVLDGCNEPRDPPDATFVDDAWHDTSSDDMFSRIETLLSGLPHESRGTRVEPDVSWLMGPPAEVASNEDLEELVSIALASAQNAEDMSREATEASRTAGRGMFVAVGAAALGIVIVAVGTISTRLYSFDSGQMADIATQVQALGDLQHQINDQLAGLRPAAAAPETLLASVASAQQSPQPLPPVEAIPVPVSPPVGTPLRSAPPVIGLSPRTEAPAASYPPAPSYDAYAPAGPPAAYARYIVYNGTGTRYHPRIRHYRTAVGLPRPVAYFIATVRRDIQTLFR